MTIEVTVHALKVHPAQMRTRVGLMELAQLAVQVADGLDAKLPLLLGTGDRVISGHRRWLARMIAYLAYAGEEPMPRDAEGALARMIATILEVCTVEGAFVILDASLYQSLVKRVPRWLTVPCHRCEVSATEEVLLLIRANTGAEEPDLVGQARAFKAAIDAGISYDRLSEIMGLPKSRLQALVALLALPQVFQDMVNDGQLALSVVLELLPLTIAAREALAGPLRAKRDSDMSRAGVDRSGYDYSARVRLAAAQMEVRPPVPRRGDVESPVYNEARAVRKLWAQTLKEEPDRLLRALAEASVRGVRVDGVEPIMKVLSDIPTAQEYFDVEEDGYGRTRVTLARAPLEALLPEMTCLSCGFSDLPTMWVKHELPFACRQHEAGVEAGPCLWWSPRGKQFSMRTPYHWWSGGKEITSFAELQSVWQEQWDREQRPVKARGMLSGHAEDMTQLRQSIRTYMERHTEEAFTVAHPWATACAKCAHHLEGSPVKSDPDAPHCAWAKGKRRLQFRAFVPKKGQAMTAMIPFCLQYEPAAAWRDIIPAPVTDPPYEREVLVGMITSLAESVNTNVYGTDSRAALQFLTGRPMTSAANHRRTFVQRFKTEVDSLSTLQLWTLVCWLLLEWQRAQHSSTTQLVPLEGIHTVECEVQFLSMALGLFRDDEDEE